MRIAAVVLVAGLAGTCLAQSGTATWEVSADGGVNWTSECLLVGSAHLLVRLRLGWTGIDNAIAFGGSQFDAVILGATDTDQVTNINRPSPFNFAAQTIVAPATPRESKLTFQETLPFLAWEPDG